MFLHRYIRVHLDVVSISRFPYLSNSFLKFLLRHYAIVNSYNYYTIITIITSSSLFSLLLSSMLQCLDGHHTCPSIDQTHDIYPNTTYQTHDIYLTYQTHDS